MYELNKKIYGDSRRAPTLNIHGDRYSFSTYGDTGTGTAFANLITFDLALLDLTCLPAVAHDLPLLKNIENPAMEKLYFFMQLAKNKFLLQLIRFILMTRSHRLLLKHMESFNCRKIKLFL